MKIDPYKVLYRLIETPAEASLAGGTGGTTQLVGECMKCLNIVKSKTQPPCSSATGIFPEECVAFLQETLRETHTHTHIDLHHTSKTMLIKCCNFIDCCRDLPSQHHTFTLIYLADTFSQSDLQMVNTNKLFILKRQ